MQVVIAHPELLHFMCQALFLGLCLYSLILKDNSPVIIYGKVSFPTLASGWRLPKSGVCPVSMPPYLPPQPPKGTEPPLLLQLMCNNHRTQGSCGNKSRKVEKQIPLPLCTDAVSASQISLTSIISSLLPCPMDGSSCPLCLALQTLCSSIRADTVFEWDALNNMPSLGIRQECLKMKNPKTSAQGPC